MITKVYSNFWVGGQLTLPIDQFVTLLSITELLLSAKRSHSQYAKQFRIKHTRPVYHVYLHSLLLARKNGTFGKEHKDTELLVMYDISTTAAQLVRVLPQCSPRIPMNNSKIPQEPIKDRHGCCCFNKQHGPLQQHLFCLHPASTSDLQWSISTTV